jgi:hypothetical protein
MIELESSTSDHLRFLVGMIEDADLAFVVDDESSRRRNANTVVRDSIL